MSDVEAEIDSAVAAVGINTERWSKLSLAQARHTCQQARDRFVVGNPRAWWLSLRHPADRHAGGAEAEDRRDEVDGPGGG